jgi:hypothetical protein
MATGGDSGMKEVTRPYLTDLLRHALGSQALEVSDWEVCPLHGGLELASAVLRFQGQAEEAGKSIPWSLILKIVRPAPENDDPQGIRNWKREALAYQSGLLYRLPGKITAPRCHAVREQADGSLWLWLEDVQDEIGTSWPLEHYGVVARHLGQFNGAYLVGQPLPSEPWITRDWVRKYVEHAAPVIEFIRHNPEYPVVQQWYPGSALAQVLAVWDVRSRLFDALDRLPQTFCHQDAFKRNLFARRDQTVAIDWGFAGIAPLGAELAALVGASLGLYEVPTSQAFELDRMCFEGYVQGLRDAGWDGSSRLVRLGYTLTLLLRYVYGGQIGEMLPALLDEYKRQFVETALSRSSEEIGQGDPEGVAYYQSVFMEALKLLGLSKTLEILGRVVVLSISMRRRGSRRA